MSIPNSFNPLGTLRNEHPLPPNYKRALYLQSSADQYIDTGVTVTPQTRVYMDVESLLSGYNGCVLSQPVRRFTVACSSGFLRLAAGANDNITDFESGNARLRIELSADGTAAVNGKPVQIDASGDVPLHKFWLFARNQTDWSNAFPTTQKLYRFKMWNGEVLVRDMVPAVRIADGKPCLVDVLTGTPFFNMRNNADFTTNFDE